MKKIISILLSVVIALLFVACNSDKQNTETTVPDVTQGTENTIVPETVPDNGEVEYEKEYTIKEMLEIKTSWNIQYVFPADFDKVKTVKEDNTNLKMSLVTSEISYENACDFYKKYVFGKDKLNSTDTGESLFISFEEDFVCRTITVVNNGDNVAITINYTMDNVNKR
jgi:hypothetical protein